MCIIDFSRGPHDWHRDIRPLLSAIEEVDSSYIEYKNYIKDLGANQGEKIAHLERVFAYELYRKWVNRMTELKVNSETTKVVHTRISYEQPKEGGKEETVKVSMFPDLVLHSSQGDANAQKIVGEIKRARSSHQAIFADLLKLSCLLDEHYFGYPFEYGVFIYVCMPKEIQPIRMKEDTEIWMAEKPVSSKDKGVAFDYIKEMAPITFGEYINNEKFSSNFHKIICIAYDGTTLEYCTLAEALGR